MGRWLDRLRKAPDGIPTELTKLGSVSSVSNPSGHFQEKASVELLASAANDPLPSSAWLHLLALTDGSVIQRCGEQPTTIVEEEARLRFGECLLSVVAVPRVGRPLTEAEIVQALAGTFRPPAAPPPASGVWIARVARLLGVRPADLLESGHLEQCDLDEPAGTDTRQVADLIRSSPAWINSSPQPVEQWVGHVVEEKVEQQSFIHTIATATPIWRDARDDYLNHLMACSACHAPISRYCPTGAELRAAYNNAAME